MKKIFAIILLSVTCIFAAGTTFDGTISGIQVYNSSVAGNTGNLHDVALFVVTSSSGSNKIFVFTIGQTTNPAGNQMLAQLYNSQNQAKTVRICFDDTKTWGGQGTYYLADCIANIE